ncbi:MAG TPA: aldo/keto reductase [Candidatus Nanopelagicales bacterium]|nr:aldo/keto reductase [Candidatus Nanopelagicales bacterium]
MKQLILGTAQWGNAYGVTNAVGRLSDEELASIVAVARQAGITEVDTARGYGDAEQRLRPFASDFSVTTKVSGAGDVASQVADSLDVLGVESLDGVLIHDWDGLDCKGQGTSVLSFSQLLDSGAVSRVGVSVYDAAGLESAVATFDAAGVPLGVVQVPANVLDRRLDASSLLMDLAAAGAQIVVRSALLQGVLLASGGGLADQADVVRFRSAVESSGSSLLEVCLAHVRGLPWAKHVVVGVTSASELREIVAAWDACEPELAAAEFGSDDLELIDPRRW